MKTYRLSLLLVLTLFSSGCGALRDFEQLLEEHDLARFPQRQATDGQVVGLSDPDQENFGHGAVVGERLVLTVAHVIEGEQARVRLPGVGAWATAHVVERIPAWPEPLVLLQVDVDSGLYGLLLGFSGFATGDCHEVAARQADPAFVQSEGGVYRWQPSRLVHGDSGSPVLDAEGKLLGLVFGFVGGAPTVIPVPARNWNEWKAPEQPVGELLALAGM